MYVPHKKRATEAERFDAIVNFMANRDEYVGQFRPFVDAVRAATDVVIADRPYELLAVAQQIKRPLAERGIGLSYNERTQPTATYSLRRIDGRVSR